MDLKEEEAGVPEKNQSRWTKLNKPQYYNENFNFQNVWLRKLENFDLWFECYAHVERVDFVFPVFEKVELFEVNPSSLKGGYNNPQTVFALVLKIAHPRGKIAPGTFKFILSLHFSEKILNLPPTPGVG